MNITLETFFCILLSQHFIELFTLDSTSILWNGGRLTNPLNTGMAKLRGVWVQGQWKRASGGATRRTGWIYSGSAVYGQMLGSE